MEISIDFYFYGDFLMRIAICDDEKKCIDDIVRHINFFSKDNQIQMQKSIFTSGEELISSGISFDIAILDVEMDGMNGIKLGEYLRKINHHIILIYITAHKQYLDDALNLNAVRFFEKPIDSGRFYRGLKDAIDRIDNSTINFYLKDGTVTERINAKDIIYVEIENRKSKVITLNKTYHSAEHISFWSDKLTGTVFVSPHKSYIINLNFVTSYERNHIILNEQYNIPIAKSKQTEFYRQFIRFMEGK